MGGAHGLRKKLDGTGLLEGGCQVQAFFSERMDESAGSDAVDGGGAAIVAREDGRDARGERGGGVARAVGAGAGGAILTSGTPCACTATIRMAYHTPGGRCDGRRRCTTLARRGLGHGHSEVRGLRRPAATVLDHGL